MDFFNFNNHTFSIEETIEIFNESKSWTNNTDGQEYIFKGTLISVKDENLQLSKPELLGYANNSEFKSKTGTESIPSKELDRNLDTEEALAIQCSDGVLIISKKKLTILPIVNLPSNIKKVHIEENKTRKKEGAWHYKKDAEYPVPPPYQLKTKEAEEIYILIKIKEAEAKETIARGLDYSVIDDTCIGGIRAFYHINWVWPGNYAEHYVFKYKVKPSDDFLKFIGWLKE
jgi:hypothetical protein